ncbi:MAG: aminomethyl-transferring glycine dehydrogenase, partial [Acidobacteriota bacterium]|nr:aminomethyl-transferring glycine dehydrogenase [Acidobacteriota bacterium]
MRVTSQNSGLSTDRGGRFADRHIGPDPGEIREMLGTLGLSSLDELVARAVPAGLLFDGELALEPPRSEREALSELRRLAESNSVLRSFIGMGYSECVTPPPIKRGILEDPGWYTAYTPYQPEISQGRLEALLNFQTMVADLTGLPIANASLLDEATAAAEAMQLCRRIQKKGEDADSFFVSELCHPQTIDVVRTRAEPLGIDVVVADHETLDFDGSFFGVLLQYPATDGRIEDLGPFCRRAREDGAFVVVATDLLALTILRPPGEFGADIVVGSTQRFGVPLGYGGPHAAFMATRDSFKRQVPGRIVGVSVDADGRPALRLAMQTREQHIRRDRATSNICTAQVLLAVVAAMYGVYHGPAGLAGIARRLRRLTATLAGVLRDAGHAVTAGPLFDTIRVAPASGEPDRIHDAARQRGINLRRYPGGDIGLSLGEPADLNDLQALAAAFGIEASEGELASRYEAVQGTVPEPHARVSGYMSHPVFEEHRSETQLMRYMHRLASRDLSLNSSMIPLGSCTMKLNAAAEMEPIGWPGFADVHPFAPEDQLPGYRELIDRLEGWLAEITGFPAVSLMPNAGAQGEYAGMLVIRAYHAARGEAQRDVCLIPQSAHGTNPASAVMAGMRVAVVGCDADGNIDHEHLGRVLSKHEGRVAALMVTYPSTHGVFEEGIRAVCDKIHEAGGQVYLDGANLNAMVGICRPAGFGADVCHLNLHKTFCIPHGGGGPGMGPIGVAAHLAPFLPGHPVARTGGEEGIGPVSAAPFGSPSILPISYAYIAMMGAEGLRRATQVAILNANYMARRLEPHYDVLYKGANGMVAHECIIDTRPFKKTAGIEVDDIAKRLMDFGFHAPTMSW